MRIRITTFHGDFDGFVKLLYNVALMIRIRIISKLRIMAKSRIRIRIKVKIQELWRQPSRAVDALNGCAAAQIEGPVNGR
jgi:hypothetical protein